MDWQLAVLGPAMGPVFQGLIRQKPEERNMKAIAEGRDRFSRAISIMEHYLKRQDYLAGSRFTIGDIPCGIMTYRWFNLDIQREDYPGVKRWYDRLAQRPAYKKHIMIKMS
jgi:glutathione S-transferase